MTSVGALITGRRNFDIAGGWGGQHPLGVPVVVVSHSVPDGWPRDDAPFTFVEGVERAVAIATPAAGEKAVVVASANIAQHCLNAGLLDEVSVSLVPVCVLETRWYAQLGSPAFGYGGGRLDISHGPNEFIDEAAVRRCAAVYALYAHEATG
ncbi:MAG: hypothetical protein WAL22_16875 [Solirubrobacteraceae bacterium]